MIFLMKIILLIILSDRIDKINSLTKAAEESFKNENYLESIENYRLLIDSFDYSNEKLYLNLAHSHLLSEDTLNAIENYNYASLTNNLKIKSIALKQIGNINERNNKLEEALSFYRESIIADNQNNDSKFNYELVKKKLDNKKEDKEKNKQKSNEKNQDNSSKEKKNDEKGKEDQKNNDNQKEKEDQKNNDNQKEKNQNNSEETVEEKLKKINMSKKKAEMILNALNNNEFQYIQQLKRKSNKKLNKNKPDW